MNKNTIHAPKVAQGVKAKRVNRYHDNQEREKHQRTKDLCIETYDIDVKSVSTSKRPDLFDTESKHEKISFSFESSREQGIFLLYDLKKSIFMKLVRNVKNCPDRCLKGKNV